MSQMFERRNIFFISVHYGTAPRIGVHYYTLPEAQHERGDQ